MGHSRSLMLVVAAAVAACSMSPTGATGPPDITFSAAPAVISAGGTLHLSVTNSSSAPIGALPCPFGLERWNGSTWVVIPTGAKLCSWAENTLPPGGKYNFARSIDLSAEAGIYRATILIDVQGGPRTGIASNDFTVGVAVP